MRFTNHIIRGAGIVAMLAGLTAFSSAASGSVVGNWTIADHGQGCWGGGNLLSDGSGGGGGNCSFSTPAGQEVASLRPVSWAFTDSSQSAVNLCAEFTGKKGPVFPIGVPVTSCIVVPVGTNAPVDLGGDTYGKVTIK